MFVMKTGHGFNCCVFISRECTFFVLNSTELKIIIYIYINGKMPTIYIYIYKYIYIYIYIIYIYKGSYGAIHQIKIPFVALDPVRDTIMIGIFI